MQRYTMVFDGFECFVNIATAVMVSYPSFVVVLKLEVKYLVVIEWLYPAVRFDVQSSSSLRSFGPLVTLAKTAIVVDLASSRVRAYPTQSLGADVI